MRNSSSEAEKLHLISKRTIFNVQFLLQFPQKTLEGVWAWQCKPGTGAGKQWNSAAPSARRSFLNCDGGAGDRRKEGQLGSWQPHKDSSSETSFCSRELPLNFQPYGRCVFIVSDFLPVRVVSQDPSRRVIAEQFPV